MNSTLDPKDVREVQQRVAMAWALAKTAKENASIDEQRAYANELLDTQTSAELV